MSNTKLKNQLKHAYNPSIDQQQNALKILINGGYGFLGTGGYNHNDMKIAALVTAYGRKLIHLMIDKLLSLGVTVAEVDTDGIICCGGDPQTSLKVVQEALPEGINISLDFVAKHAYIEKKKSYLLFSADNLEEVKRVGNFRKRNRSKLELDFPVKFIKNYLVSPESAIDYYNDIRTQIENRTIDINLLKITRKVPKNDKKLVQYLNCQVGDRVTYYFSEGIRTSSKTGKPLKSEKIPTTTDEYWIEYYLEVVDKKYRTLASIIGF